VYHLRIGRERDRTWGLVVLLAGVMFVLSLVVREGKMIKNRRMAIIAGATVLVLMAGASGRLGLRGPRGSKGER
jgi:hypothetical protein